MHHDCIAQATHAQTPAYFLPLTGWAPWRLLVHRSPSKLLADNYTLVFRCASGGQLRALQIDTYDFLLSARFVRNAAGNSDIVFGDYAPGEWRAMIHRLMRERLARKRGAQ